jgi:hypothetical protein
VEGRDLVELSALEWLFLTATQLKRELESELDSPCSHRFCPLSPLEPYADVLISMATKYICDKELEKLGDEDFDILCYIRHQLPF